MNQWSKWGSPLLLPLPPFCYGQLKRPPRQWKPNQIQFERWQRERDRSLRWNQETTQPPTTNWVQPYRPIHIHVTQTQRRPRPKRETKKIHLYSDNNDEEASSTAREDTSNDDSDFPALVLLSDNSDQSEDAQVNQESNPVADSSVSDTSTETDTVTVAEMLRPTTSTTGTNNEMNFVSNFEAGTTSVTNSTTAPTTFCPYRCAIDRNTDSIEARTKSHNNIIT